MCSCLFLLCVFLSISLILCLSCGVSALCVSPVCLRLVGKVGKLLISLKNKRYLQAPLKPSVACVHVYLLTHPLGRQSPPTSPRRTTGLQLLTEDLWHVSPKCLAPMAPHRLAPRCANSLPLPATFRSITVRYQWGPSWGSRQKWHFQSASTYYPSSASGLVKLDLWLGCQHK